MARIDALQSAVAAYAADQWDEDEWRQLGRDTGTTDILMNHPRLYRSLSFGDPDYPDAALSAMGRVLEEAVEPGTGEGGRMKLLVNSMPDLPDWIATKAPARTKRLFNDYIAARDLSEIPFDWFPSGAQEPDVTAPWETEPAAVPERTPAPQAAMPPGSGLAPASLPNLFIVHGHDEAARDSIRIYVHKLTGVMPISLAEEAGRGKTIIEKFETYGTAASFVIVLLTPDDVGQTVADRDAGTMPNFRARQNVVLELGYFIGKIGRDNIVVVVDKDVERPSDLAGLSYVEYPGSNWKDDLRVELQAAALTL
ncbi:TIR domain-containing protein [Cryobacterium sp. MLB-32]|uniref:TIR domain-containing protein n=1 Tax=Cryobacterium sp. MLB-32 TaxID=1529318 RepID=UPI0009DE0672|nr:TIR domain-containing protein [Cryobacterium sp. MLB-32]